MTLTVRSATVTGATTKGSALTHAELDENFNHLSQSSGVSFTQSGSGVSSGASSRTVNAKLSEIEVSLLDFPVVFDDSTDNSTALQNQFNKGPGVAFAVPIGIARFATGLTWTNHRFGLYGKAPPIRGNQTDAGPCLKYTGTGTGLLLGVNPGVAGTFLEEAQIENLRLKVGTTTSIALRLYMLAGGRLRNVFVYGNSGSRTGIKVEGCIDTTLEGCDVQGQEGAGGVSASYLQHGIQMIGGFSNSPTTTTTFRQCYLHYCLAGATVADHSIWEDCIFEACTNGMTVGANAVVRLNRPWFESNVDKELYLTAGCEVVLENSANVNSGSRQHYFDGAGAFTLIVRNNRFLTSHVAPRFFDPAGSSIAGARIVMDSNVLPSAFTIGGNGIDWRDVQVIGMRLATYRFRQTAVAANTAYDMPQDNGSTNAFNLPEKGHLLASYCYYVGATITAGTFDTAVKKNGSAVANLTSGNFSATPGGVHSQYYANTFAAGDTLQAYVHTSGTFAATGGEFITEVIVAFGEDGL